MPDGSCAPGATFLLCLHVRTARGGLMSNRSSLLGQSADPIRLVMVEPRALLGLGIRDILERETDIEVVGQAVTPEEAQSVVDATSPTVVLIDASLAESGMWETRRLRRRSPDAAFVVLGGHDDDASILEAIEIGAMGHISEVAQPAELVETIRRVAYGDDPLRDELRDRPDLLARAFGALRDTPAIDHVESSLLTPREIEVLRLVAQGLKNREIAARFDVAEQTVKNQLRTVMRKLGAPNRTQAVMAAVRHGWLIEREGVETI